MDKNASCVRILLAKNEAGRVGYCEGCDVVELEIGAMSLRIDAKDYEQHKPEPSAGHVH